MPDSTALPIDRDLDRQLQASFYNLFRYFTMFRMSAYNMFASKYWDLKPEEDRLKDSKTAFENWAGEGSKVGTYNQVTPVPTRMML